MLTFLTKSLPIWLQPLGLIWLLLLAWLLLKVWRRQWICLVLPGTIWLLLTLTTVLPLSAWLVHGLESKHPSVTLATLPPHDAIICLGGGVSPSSREPSGIHLKLAGDRIIATLRLIQAGKASQVVLGGGASIFDGEADIEAEAVQHWLQATLPTDSTAASPTFHSLGKCSDTRDEAVKTAALAQQKGWQRLLLVTSASHMPRAAATFEKAGLQITPVPCNYLVPRNFSGPAVDTLHPPAFGGLELYAVWFHEFLGSLAYRWRGWLD